MDNKLPKPFEYVAEVRCNATGEVRRVLQSWEFAGWDGPRSSVQYFWTDGNFGCDCNRAIQFAGVFTIDTQCGESAYSVRLSDADGVFYNEFSDD